MIIVFAKPAAPGDVKTRLVPLLTPEQAAQFHLAALDDVLATATRAAPGRVELHVAGDEDAAAEFRRRYPDLVVRRQRPGALGERLTAAFADAFERGARRVIIVGSDHPTLPPASLSEAIARLRSLDVAFGPSRDGGYYAVGIARAAWPRARGVFARIPWSTAAVFETSLERARVLGLRVATLPEWYDVDRPDDLALLRRDAAPESAAARFLHRLDQGSNGESFGSGAS